MDRFTYEDRRVKVYSLGFMYHDNTFIIDAEIVRSKTNSLLPSSTGGYILTGYKMNNFTPYIYVCKK